MSLWHCNQCGALTGGSVGAPQCAKCASYDVAWTTMEPQPQTTTGTMAITPSCSAVPSCCEWTEDEDGVWQTSCGDAFVFTTGGPRENKMKWCAYCGLWLVEVAYEENNDDRQ